MRWGLFPASRGLGAADDDGGEALDALCRSTDYGLLQEADDAGRRFDRFGGVGYHDTSPERAGRIRVEGLGAHPGRTYGAVGGGIEGHEVDFWLCAWSDPAFAAPMAVRLARTFTIEGARALGDEVAAHLRARHPDLRVVWFYPDKMEAGISKYQGARCAFNLRAVVEWLATHAADGPYVYGSRDMGWSLSWRGPAIPSKMLRWSAR